MNYTYNYEEVLQSNGLKYSQLPEDAQIGIDNIKDIAKAVMMAEKKGKSPTEKTMKKIAALDKWVTYEIYDFLEGTDKNDDEMPYESDEVVEEIIEETSKQQQPEGMFISAALGTEIEKELIEISKVKTTWNVEELQTAAPKTYNVLYDAYGDDDEDNGVETNNYKIIEQADGKFKISSK